MALHLVCPTARRSNRVPSERPGEAPDGGRCHRPPGRRDGHGRYRALGAFQDGVKKKRAATGPFFNIKGN